MKKLVIIIVFFLSFFSSSCIRYRYSFDSSGRRCYIVNIDFKKKYETNFNEEGLVYISKIKKYKENLYVIYAMKNNMKCVLLSYYMDGSGISKEKIKEGNAYNIEIHPVRDRDRYAFLLCEIGSYLYYEYDISFKPTEGITIADIYETKHLNGLYIIKE